MEQFYYECSKPGQNLNLKQYVYRIGSYHYNWHSDLELLLVLGGQVEVCTNGHSSVLEADDLILINSNMGHATLAREPDSIAMVLHIDPAFLKEYYHRVECLQFDICSGGENRERRHFQVMRSCLAEMMLCRSQDGPEKKLGREKAFYTLMHTVVSGFPPKEIRSSAFRGNQKKRNAIDGMIKFLNKNYQKKITLDILAKESGYNKSYISQLFKSYLGINFYDYLTRIRLREATRALSQTQDRILEIALDNGFSDLKSFNSLFKETFGKSPTQYRRQLSAENCRHDAVFKKQFVDTADTQVCEKLQEYVREGRDEGGCAKVNPDVEIFNELRTLVKELTHTLNQVSGGLSGTAERLDQEIKKLTER